MLEPTKKPLSLTFILTILTAIVLIFPLMSFQSQLAQGDHGRDLYSFDQTFQGAVPYRDYSSQNGPLMPYYYSLFYLLFGSSIQTTLFAYYLLIILTGIFIYEVGRCYLSPFASYLCALWYWTYRHGEFFYTYNHAGAICLLAAVLLCLFRYIRYPRDSYVHWGTFLLFFITLIRPNIGLSSAIAFYLCVALTDYKYQIAVRKQKIPRYIGQFLLVCTGAFIIYWLLNLNTPKFASKTDLNYLSHAEWFGFLKAFPIFGQTLFNTFLGSSLRKLFAVFLLLCVLLSRRYIKNKQLNVDQKRIFFLTFASLGIFFAFNFLEFILKPQSFRMYWVYFVLIILIISVIDVGKNYFSNKIYQLAFLFIPLAMAFSFQTQFQEYVAKSKSPRNLLDINGNTVYLDPSSREWLFTTYNTYDFISKNVPEDEKIICIPYCPLHYYLPKKQNGTRTLFYFGLEGEKEKHVIDEIIANGVNYIIISNRSYRDGENRLGTFGKTYGIKFYEYIMQNFDEAVTIGPWHKTAYWTHGHAVKIYRRK